MIKQSLISKEGHPSGARFHVKNQAGASAIEYALIAVLAIAALWGFTEILKQSAKNYYLNSNNSFNYVTDDVLVN